MYFCPQLSNRLYRSFFLYFPKLIVFVLTFIARFGVGAGVCCFGVEGDVVVLELVD